MKTSYRYRNKQNGEKAKIKLVFFQLVSLVSAAETPSFEMGPGESIYTVVSPTSYALQSSESFKCTKEDDHNFSKCLAEAMVKTMERPDVPCVSPHFEKFLKG